MALQPFTRTTYKYPTIRAGLSSAAKSAFDEAKGYYSEGGGFLKGVTSQLDRARTKFMSSAMQGLVSSGLANTSGVANIAGKFAEETAAPTLARAESERAQALANIALSRASAEESSYRTGINQLLQTIQTQMSQTPSYATSNAPVTPSVSRLSSVVPRQNTISDKLNFRSVPNLFA